MSMLDYNHGRREKPKKEALAVLLDIEIICPNNSINK